MSRDLHVQAPTAVRVVDLDRPITDLALSATSNGRPYTSLLAVPRIHGCPLTTLYLDLRETESADALACTLWDRLGEEIDAHLRADGIARADGAPRASVDADCADPPLRTGPPASVIVTTCADVISTLRCLETVMALAYRPFEVIVVENRPAGSAVRAAVKARFGDDAPIRVVDEPRRGLAAARNTGLHEAEGEIIAVIDDDVAVDPDWLGRIAKRFQEEPQLSCVTGLILPAELETNEQALIERFAAFGKGFSRQTFALERAPESDRLFPYAGGQFGSGANTALRAEAVERFGGYEERLGAGTPARGGEDLDLFIRLLLAGAHIGYEPAALVWHRHPSGANAPRRQAINYGIGLAAMLTHRWLVGGDRRRMARAVPAGLGYLRDGKSRRNIARGEDFPRSLVLWETLGFAAGPFAYLRSRSRHDRLARSALSPRWVEEIELTELVADRPVPRDEDGRRYGVARLLMRKAGQPLGFLELELPTGKLRASRLHAEVNGSLGGAPTATDSANSGPPTNGRARSTTQISVVICTRERPESLRATVASVLKTAPGPLEVLVVDNAPGTDGTRALVQEIDDVRLRYLVEPVPGLSRARNRGLAEARGEIVAFTDDDVVVDAGWLGGLAQGFARAPDVASVTGVVAAAELDTPSQQIFESKVAWTTNCTPRIWDISTPPAGDVLFPYTAGQFGTGANFALKRELVPVLGPFDEALGAGTPCGGGEDLDMFVRVLLQGFRLAYEPTALVWHRHRREPDALRSQMFSYSAGLSAYACKQLLRRETRSDVVRRLPEAVLRAGRIAGRGATSGEMLRAQLWGYVWGPVLYAQSVRKLGRGSAMAGR